MVHTFEILGGIVHKHNIIVMNMVITLIGILFSITITVMVMAWLNVDDFTIGIWLSFVTPLFGSPPITHIFLKLLDRMHTINHKLQETQLEVKRYRELLPICANCKDIRDEQGSWKRIDTYIAQHSEINFTHSICPSCSEHLYGDFLKHNKPK
ncbi:MAG: hypothetical protein COA61_000590 [Zetaproteobacteria bacterium]|nr:hypothetical protein [Zetaproteobacteria bacterium]